MDPTKKAVPCSCSHACLYYMIRCDACHRGVHFSCIGMTLAAAATKMVYVCRTCQDTVHEDDLSEQLKAQRKPGAVVFTATCRQHNSVTGERRGTSTTTPTLIHRDEELSTARCDACDIRCSFDLIQCDECAAWCHYACAKMTPKLATSIDKWYCGGCRRKDSALEITYVRGLVPEKHPCNRRQGARQRKRQIEAEANDRPEKKARLCATRLPVQYVIDERPAEEPELELDLDDVEPEPGFEEELTLDLEEDEPELELDSGKDVDQS